MTSDKQDKVTMSSFLPSSAINRFLALQSQSKEARQPATSMIPPSSSSTSSSSPPSKKPRIDTVQPGFSSPHMPQLCLPKFATRAVSRARSLSRTGFAPYASTASPVRSEPLSSPTAKDASLILKRTSTNPNSVKKVPVVSIQQPYIDLPVTAPRAYDPLPPPDSKETHRYIASNRLLQKTALVKALEDPDYGRASLIERDFEYLRVIAPDTVQSQDMTSLVEADLILDEHTAVIFHPLGDLGQAAGMDVEAGLNTLVTTLSRIAPRYKTLWLIFEEYYSPVSLMTLSLGSGSTTTSKSLPRAPSIPSILARPNPYAGPTIKYLSQFMAWVPTTQTRTQWLSRIHRATEPQGVQQQQQEQRPFGIQDPRQAMDEIPFETQVLFASDERCAARMVRAIGEGVLRWIDRAAKDGIRRDEDGWRNAEEWLWRDWLNDQDSTHERFLSAFRLFNPFSIQLILSLCSLKEFIAMDHQQRCKTVGRFIDPSILAIFDSVVATPLS